MQQETRKPGSRESSHDMIDIGRMVRTLWNGKLILAICTALSVLAGGYYAYVIATPIYSASSVLVLNSRQEQVVDLEGVMGGLSNDSSVINTEVEVLKSRDLIGKVVAGLDLTRDPEFNALLRDPSALSRLRIQMRRLYQGQPLPETTDPAELEQRVHDAVVTELSEQISVSNLAKSLVFRITVGTRDGHKSARIADALAEAYILNQIAVKYEATEQATAWLTGRVAELQIALEEAENKVKTFRTDTELVSQEALRGLEIQLKTLRDRIRDTEELQAQAADRLAALRAATTPEDQARVTGDTTLQRLLGQLSGSANSRATFQQRFDTLQTRADQDRQRAEAQLASLTTSMAELETQIETQSADLINLQQLGREAEASRLLYEHFLNRLKETSAQQGVQQADSRVLSKAVVPYFPAAPRKSVILLASAFFGFLGASAWLFIREFRSTTFRAPEELDRITGYATIGQVPRIPVRKRDQAIAYLSEKPTSAAAEAIRNLRTSVLLSNIDNPPQVIMLCSSLPGEGKTTLSLALAHNFVGMGKRVLLIEGDMRRRIFRKYMKDANKGGLIGLLTGEILLEEAVIHDDLVGADILTAGTTPSNPADLLSSQRFAQMIAELRQRYDQIIIDTPPVLVVPDARIISQHVDATVFSVKWDSTSAEQVNAALRAFESAGHRIAGFVLNQIHPKGMRRYGYGGKYGSYAAYGSKYYTN